MLIERRTTLVSLAGGPGEASVRLAPANGYLVTVKVIDANFGAWVLRCNPLLSDPAKLFRDGPVEIWCVASNYRSRLMQCGQPVLLWVTGSRPALYDRGFWGAGHLTGPVFTGPAGGKLYSPMRMELFSAPVAASVVAAVKDLNDIEVLRQPQMSNPSFLTLEQLRCLEPLLPVDLNHGPATAKAYDARGTASQFNKTRSI